jgi:hypothetical protein
MAPDGVLARDSYRREDKALNIRNRQRLRQPWSFPNLYAMRRSADLANRISGELFRLPVNRYNAKHERSASAGGESCDERDNTQTHS